MPGDYQVCTVAESFFFCLLLCHPVLLPNSQSWPRGLSDCCGVGRKPRGGLNSHCYVISSQPGLVGAVGCWWAQHNNLAKRYLSLGISGCAATGLLPPSLPPPPPLPQRTFVNSLLRHHPKLTCAFPSPLCGLFISWSIPEAVWRPAF